MAGPVVYHYWDNYEDNKDRILGDPSVIGLDSSNIYSKKTYLGGRFPFLLIILIMSYCLHAGLIGSRNLLLLAGNNKNMQTLYSLTSDMTVHAALSDPAR